MIYQSDAKVLICSGVSTYRNVYKNGKGQYYIQHKGKRVFVCFSKKLVWVPVGE